MPKCLDKVHPWGLAWACRARLVLAGQEIGPKPASWATSLQVVPFNLTRCGRIAVDFCHQSTANRTEWREKRLDAQSHIFIFIFIFIFISYTYTYTYTYYTDTHVYTYVYIYIYTAIYTYIQYIICTRRLIHANSHAQICTQVLWFWCGECFNLHMLATCIVRKMFDTVMVLDGSGWRMTDPPGKMGANRDAAGIGTWAEHTLEDDGRNI